MAPDDEPHPVATCRRCTGEFAPEELTRHENGPLLLVHCPDCGMFLGRYRRR